MSAGTPLTDEDRTPWLELVRASALRMMGEPEEEEWDRKAGEDDGSRAEVVVFACSALKRSYRELLRGAQDHPAHLHPGTETVQPHIPTYFVHLDGPREVLLTRMTTRKGHFFKEKMLDSQLATLERPDLSVEKDVVVVDIQQDTDKQVEDAIRGLEALGAIPRSSSSASLNRTVQAA